MTNVDDNKMLYSLNRLIRDKRRTQRKLALPNTTLVTLHLQTVNSWSPRVDLVPQWVSCYGNNT